MADQQQETLSHDDNKNNRHVATLGAVLLGLVLDEKQNSDTKVKSNLSQLQQAKLNWRHVARQGLSRKDPWEILAETCPIERAVEHIFDAEKQVWKSRNVLVRIDMNHVAGKGAMRECFKMKLKHEPSSDDFSWVGICCQSVCDTFNGVGRKTALRLRNAMGLPSVSIHSHNILSIRDIFQFVMKNGVPVMSRILAEECRNWEDQDQFMALVEENNREIATWSRGSLNCMAKRYLNPQTDNEAYRNDVVMQATSKLLCSQFNLLNPPKSIDMLHVGLIELVDREDKPLLGYESFIDGKYIKWNTNSGWMEDKVIRHTPNAFSFTSFRLTKGEKMVVDIQGVDDLYTDPQIHTRDMKGFGEGNLGPRGMALFLRSFRFDLNPIVNYLALQPFALANGELCPLDENEEVVRKARAGSSYLESEEWHERAMKRAYSSSKDGVDVSDANELPSILLDWAASLQPLECPHDADAVVPASISAEAEVHAALAKLYEENDERVITELGACTIEEAKTFHIWMAALGGSVPAMHQCADATPRASKQHYAWLNIAAKRGSQDACMEILDLVPVEDHIMIIYFLQLALKNAPESDEEQRKLMKPCRYEIHEKLAKEFEIISEMENAREHYQSAADNAMTLNLFHLNAKFQEQVERLSS